MEGKTRKERQRKERQWNNRRTRTDKEWKDNERQGNGREDNERKDNERKDNERFGGAGTPSQRFSALPLGGRMVRSPAKGFLISNFFWKQTLVFEEFLEIGHQGMTRHGRKFSYFPWEIKINLWKCICHVRIGLFAVFEEQKLHHRDRALSPRHAQQWDTILKPRLRSSQGRESLSIAKPLIQALKRICIKEPFLPSKEQYILSKDLQIDFCRTIQNSTLDSMITWQT